MAEDRMQLIETMCGKMIDGGTVGVVLSEATYNTRSTAKQRSYAEYVSIYKEASAMAAAALAKNKQEAALAQQADLDARKARVAAGLSKTKTKLLDRDTGFHLPKTVLSAMETAIKSLLSPEQLEEFNSELRKKSGAITFFEIAFIACIHRDSILNNHKQGDRFRGTSPFCRFNRLRKIILKQEETWDNRQIRYALDILVLLGFTEEIEPALKGTDKKTTRAGIWSLSDDEFWSNIFANKSS